MLVENADQARLIWASRMEQIERALKRGYDPLPISAVTEQLEEGAAQAWFTENSTAITKIYERGDKRICDIYAAGGNLEELIELKDQKIEPFARSMSCDRMLIVGRNGWRKVLVDYKLANIVLMKELD